MALKHGEGKEQLQREIAALAARLVAERCRLAVGGLPVQIQHEGASVTLVTARVGLVMVHPNAEVRPVDVVAYADRLLTQSALQGREHVSVGVMTPVA